MSERLPDESRRRFIEKFSFLAVLPIFPVAFFSCSGTETTVPALVQSESCEWCGAADAPKNVSWKTTIAKPEEPGEPLIITGTVYKEDGKTPAGGILIYAYHTNAKGYYRTNEGEHHHGRLRGWMRTGRDGRYEFRTIKPGGYPNRTDPAHIHLTVSGEGYPEYWIDSIWFEGDERIKPEMVKRLSGRGGFNPIIKLERDANNVWRAARNIKLENFK